MADLMDLYQNDIVSNSPVVPALRPTGITLLDRALHGGIPSGSVVYFLTDPRSMSEIFLYQFTQARKTYYFTTERKPKYVLQDIVNIGFNTDNITFIDIYSEYYLSPGGEMIDNIGNEYVDAKIIELTEERIQHIQSLGEKDINIIIDSFSFYLTLNVNPGKIRRMLNIIYEVTKEQECLTFLYGLKDTHDKVIEHEILKECDVIFEVELEKKGDRVQNKLAIPKIRGMIPTTDLIKFKIGEGVQIDTSHDIA